MVWICAEKKDANKRVFFLMLSSAYRVKTFFASPSTPSAARLGVHKELEGDTARTA